MCATLSDQAFLLFQLVVVVILLVLLTTVFVVSVFVLIFIVFIGESEHQADDFERESCGRESALSIHGDEMQSRNEEVVWASVKDLVVFGREISKRFGGFNGAHSGEARATKERIRSRPTRCWG
jgi:hypothetical protein